MADAKKKREPTKRAEILLWVLDCINRDAYDDFEEYMIFGGSLDDLLEAADHPGQGEEDNKNRLAREFAETIRDVAGEVAVHRGRSDAKRRTSLDGPTKQMPTIKGLERLNRLSPEIADFFRNWVDAPQISETAPHKLEIQLDHLDAYYAKEVLGKLDGIVHRVSTLEPLDIRGIPNERVRKYFEEAHRCSLYGFPIACAVLCRALLESALHDAIELHQSLDRGNVLPQRTEVKDTGASDKLNSLIVEARDRCLLTEYSRVCADAVRTAGTSAIHDLDRFNQVYTSDQLGEVLVKARIVLRELYGHAELSG